MIAPDLLEILRCPHCVRDKEGLLVLVRDPWLVCQEPPCQRQYPLFDAIPPRPPAPAGPRSRRPSPPPAEGAPGAPAPPGREGATRRGNPPIRSSNPPRLR